MNAVVVYESLWGNTAAVARAIAEGLGAGARAMTTSEATAEVVGAADLIVAGAPLLGFSLPTDDMRANIAQTETRAPAPPDVAHPSLRAWIAGLRRAAFPYATFETRIWWSPGSAAKTAGKLLAAAGGRELAAPQRFLVTGRYGPLKAGELDRARAWGAELAARAAQAG